MLSPGQRKLLQLARRQLGFEEEQYRLALQTHGGVDSSRDLDNAGFDRMMKYFRQCGFRPTLPLQRSFGERPGMATPAQIEFIRRLWREWSGGCNERALDHWLEHAFHIASLRFLTTAMAAKAINGLQAMVRRRHPAPPRDSHAG